MLGSPNYAAGVAGLNWEAIGAVGEILGATGVIITLIYLAVQVRQNSHQIERNIESNRLTAEDAIVRSFNEWRALHISDKDVADLFIRGLQDPGQFDAADRMRFNFQLSSFSWTAWQLWRVQNLLGTPNTASASFMQPLSARLRLRGITADQNGTRLAPMLSAQP